MKMPMNWAKEFAEFECTPQEFADRMTMSGSKVETYECEADGIKTSSWAKFWRSSPIRIPTIW
ncbi:MAG: hypothetical protein ACLSBB_00860 [Ruthenibacterium lactatiformans]